MQAVADDVFYSIYQYLGFGLIFAVICMIALPEVENKGLNYGCQTPGTKLQTQNEQNMTKKSNAVGYRMPDPRY